MLVRATLVAMSLASGAAPADETQPRNVGEPAGFFAKYCHECHGRDSQEGALNLVDLPRDWHNADHFRRWVKVHDRLAVGEMPPRSATQPAADERAKFVEWLRGTLVAAERTSSAPSRAGTQGSPEPADAPSQLAVRRLTRAEYENTIRDLFDMPGIALAGNLPQDGSAHGFDKHVDALDISHVNLAKYLESADQILHYAIAVRPQPPTVHTRRISLANRGGFVAHVLLNGDGVLLKNGQPDPAFPPAGEQNHLDEGAHERFGTFRTGSSVGLFRHEDESFSPYFIEHVTIYPGRYRVRTSLWSFQWDKGRVLPGRGTEAARLSVVQLTGDGRGGQHPSYVLGYYDAPSTTPREHEVDVWLNHNEMIGFNTASLAPAANYARKGRALAFTGPGIVCDWLDIEGPLHESWPPHSHRALFGQLPLVEFKPQERPNMRPPTRLKVRQLGAGMNRPDPEPGLWTVQSEQPERDADRLLAAFLPRLFRRPVPAEIRQEYVARATERLTAGDSFEAAMRAAYKAAFCSPDFLYHVEPAAGLDDFALASRLSYFLWNSLPDETLFRRAAAGELRRPDVLRGEVERLLQDPRSRRFIDDFVGQWLKLRQIAANDPDKKLYPEFSAYLQDSMVAETRGYFRELLDKDLDARHLVRSDFVMINEKLATHYGIPGVVGSQVRRVPLPDGCPRGGFLTQAAILKLTANGTTTSPVPRGAFVMDRIVGEPPEPPPSNVAAIEPDVRGATTVREQLDKHRANAACASCHAKIDPPGFALESFDVIGGFRTRYRSIGAGDPAERGSIDPFIPLGFKLGPAVDPAGQLGDGRKFADIREYQTLLSAQADRLLRNLARQLATYATGREPRFSDRPAIEAIVRATQEQGGGVRTLVHHFVQSPLFLGQPPALTDKLPEFPVEPLGGVKGPSAEPPGDSPPNPPTPAAKTGDAEAPSVDSWPTTVARITGLFDPQRIEALRNFAAQSREIRVRSVDWDKSEAVVAYDANSELFRGAKPEQVIERINSRLRDLSNHTLGASAPSQTPRDKLARVEIPIVGLDCPACCLSVYETLIRTEGVEQATASFRDRRATAWIDPAKTSREALVKLLKQRGVTIAEE